jgi:hypothetical protein
MTCAAETTHSNREGTLFQPLEGSPETPKDRLWHSFLDALPIRSVID